MSPQHVDYADAMAARSAARRDAGDAEGADEDLAAWEEALQTPVIQGLPTAPVEGGAAAVRATPPRRRAPGGGAAAWDGAKKAASGGVQARGGVKKAAPGVHGVQRVVKKVKAAKRKKEDKVVRASRSTPRASARHAA